MSDDQARVALDDIERMIADGEAAGLSVEPWLFDLAEELRAVLPTDPVDPEQLASRMRARPDASLHAHGAVDAGAVGRLKG